MVLLRTCSIPLVCAMTWFQSLAAVGTARTLLVNVTCLLSMSRRRIRFLPAPAWAPSAQLSPHPAWQARCHPAWLGISSLRSGEMISRPMHKDHCLSDQNHSKQFPLQFPFLSCSAPGPANGSQMLPGPRSGWYAGSVTSLSISSCPPPTPPTW